jgi:membrane-associated PAP2 superfamily phosphatase
VFLAERRRRLARAFLLLGVAFGLSIGVERMARGAHFLSDVVWSGGIVCLVGYALFCALRLDRPVAGLADRS